MTYKMYISISGKADSKALYREYLEKHDFLFPDLPETMKEQYAADTYKFRFCKEF